MNLLSQRAYADGELCSYAGQAIDPTGPWTGSVNHHRRFDFFSIAEFHASDSLIALDDLGDGAVEQKSGT
jgi:hypothetical protein